MQKLCVIVCLFIESSFSVIEAFLPHFQQKRLRENTPVALAKAKKNEMERNGMRASHVNLSINLIVLVVHLIFTRFRIAGYHYTEACNVFLCRNEMQKH